MGKNTKYDAGEGGSGIPFYVTHFEPNDWWKWFENNESHDKEPEQKENAGDQNKKENNDPGWTEVLESIILIIINTQRPIVTDL